MQGFGQEFGFDYDETYAPVIRIDNVRLLFAIGAYYRDRGVVMWHVDFNNAFQNGGPRGRLSHLHPATAGVYQSAISTLFPPPLQIALWSETSVTNLVYRPLSVDPRSWVH